jgi:hypothetical protein
VTFSRNVADGSRIEAERFDLGGEGVAYHDTTVGNSGGQLRLNEDVDIGTNSDGGSPSYSIGWIANGEWLHYTVDVTAGTYDISARVASNNSNPGSISLKIGDGTSFTELGVFDVNPTGGWDTWQTLTLNGIDLNSHAGTGKVLRLEMVGGNFNLNWIEFNSTAVASTVVTRGVGYGGATAAYGQDAIDTSKEAYRFLPGTSTTTANYTNYTQGLNRVMVELANSQPATLTIADFDFRVGNTNDPANWTLLDSNSVIPLPTIINGTRNSSTGVQRFTLVWPGGKIKNQWLQVTVKANSNTGLPTDDVFYFGNQVADVYGVTAPGNRVVVNAIDTIQIRANQNSAPNSVGINHVYDIDRNGAVNSLDTILARANQASGGGLLMLTAPAQPQTASRVSPSSPPSLTTTPAVLPTRFGSEVPPRAAAEVIIETSPVTWVLPMEKTAVRTTTVEDPSHRREQQPLAEQRTTTAARDLLFTETDLVHPLTDSFEKGLRIAPAKTQTKVQTIDQTFAKLTNLWHKFD